ncbi:DUF3048 domain-containing protein [Candidatus Saccharibacteria bacterium]|nr:DUF3048 domain-containing protein [Candidatus Saccharibacteria bacterium]MBR6122225.1 DUF3048 domain-containing protein [Candidatus Saccharibacteria bacterium]
MQDSPEELAKKMAKSRVEHLELPKETPEEKQSKKALIITLSIVAFVLIGGGLAAYFLFLNKPAEEASVETPPEETIDPIPTKTEEEPDTPHYYSRLSGEEVADESAISRPTYCVQIPNGVDGARPQVGLQDAKVVFEAIAESGITRFAAIFQDPPAVIGPIRSLRLYYLNWDVPFDCTVVHAGGSEEALKAVKEYGVRDLSENYSFMWRSSTNYTVQRLWNNLFTSNEYLNGHSTINGYLSSDVRSFARFTPPQAARNKIDVQAEERLKIDQPSTKDTDALAPKVTHITMRIGAMPNFNPVYDYDATTNTYKRSYETGAAHTSYDCTGKTGELTPELVCEETQITASVVIGMLVQERKASYDNYHEDISTIGAGDAYIFQNGIVIKGTWEKPSKDSQISFKDASGAEVKLVPGKTWISAIPASYGGSVQY